MSIVIPNRLHGYPYNDTTRSIDEVIRGLTVEKWATWISGQTPYKFDLGLPRFKFEYEIELTELLKTLGMEIAFSRFIADFTNLFVDSVGWIDEVKQKTFIQVDEKGTEAAAVTQVVFADSFPPQLICDRPFLTVIHEDNSGAILFMGRIANPVWED
jgi:serine protease inhibitor